ncbi:hypothetical protein EMIHUDRAFT_446492 [Emiliania huxleyi CCMP1516]|uniref:Uncharacterized protein n=2 Tax=Emiliania huxleyi TaxID=2903 RepID=A0A0D3I5U3_EMIH1|nr:hypothetical protein EMIHUDRAFT_446492 [Emiliania huxleyi CCMP1516]EOD06628.1 hypothetical protein EMIHUDRAFT_446492 [Emiliania huxleyi CCMP1516]|eukprot:XP_005759057.1 hypothetical protein EMIHUDRAFT_446492 [Emiliania huxleyi CCMP1516]
MWASGPAAAARPVEAGLGSARDGWPPTSALALLVKMAAVAIAATKVQAYSAQAFVVFRLLSHFAHARAARPASLREGMCLPRFEPAAKSCSLEPRPTLPPRPQLLSSPENWCPICCLPADAAGEPGGPLYYKEVLTRFLLEFFYPHDSERECDRTIGSFSLQSGITREQLSLPLASPPSPSGIRGILWVVQSIDLWLVSRSLDDDHEVQRSPPRWPLRKASRPRRTHGAGSLGYGTGPSFG